MSNHPQVKKGWRNKFRVALRGVALGVRGQSSYFVHFFVAALVCVAAAVLQVATWQWCLLVVAISMVLTAEMLNTALEWLARGITKQHDQNIGNALDIGSGAVLLASIGASVVGLIVFLPRLLAILDLAG